MRMNIPYNYVGHYKYTLHTFTSRFLSTPHSIAHTSPDSVSNHHVVFIVTDIEGVITLY